MRNAVLLGAVLASLVFAGCEKAITPEAVPPTPTRSTPPSSTPALATPVPTTPATEPKSATLESTPRPTMPERRSAPDRFYVLRTATKIETDTGILGVKRGTQLTKVGDMVYTTPDGHELSLSPKQVTNDPAEIQQILDAEHMAKSALSR